MGVFFCVLGWSTQAHIKREPGLQSCRADVTRCLWVSRQGGLAVPVGGVSSSEGLWLLKKVEQR